jgi:cold-inducible RNA-binding protein
MGKMLSVGNLGFGVSGSDLQRLFARHGDIVSAEVVTNLTSCRSTGVGLVEMGSDAEAQAAIAGLDGKDYGGRPLKVYEATPCEDRVSVSA